MDAIYQPGYLAADLALRSAGELLTAFGFGPVERPCETTASGPRWRLRDYGGGGAALLVVPSPINRPYIWDLAPDISTIGYCLDQGFRVHMVEWAPFELGDQASGLDDYIDALANAVAAATAAAGAARPVLLGHSLGGTLAAIFAAHDARASAGTVLLSSPLCFGVDAGPFAAGIARLAGAAPQAHQLVLGAFVSQLMARASASVWPGLASAAASLANAEAFANHLRLERWALDGAALPGKAVGQVIDWLYREDRFRRGLLPVKGRTLGPPDLIAPTLSVINTADDIVPRGAVGPFLAAAPAASIMLEYAGEHALALEHVGLLVGLRARRELWPQIVNWMDGVAAARSPRGATA
jgi:polyhydroxyalkanoate synthase